MQPEDAQGSGSESARSDDVMMTEAIHSDDDLPLPRRSDDEICFISRSPEMDAEEA